jgi:hypothetical protein
VLLRNEMRTAEAFARRAAAVCNCMRHPSVSSCPPGWLPVTDPVMSCDATPLPHWSISRLGFVMDKNRPMISVCPMHVLSDWGEILNRFGKVSSLSTDRLARPPHLRSRGPWVSVPVGKAAGA